MEDGLLHQETLKTLKVKKSLSEKLQVKHLLLHIYQKHHIAILFFLF